MNLSVHIFLAKKKSIFVHGKIKNDMNVFVLKFSNILPHYSVTKD